MYTDLSKIKKTDISIPKGTEFYLFKDGRIGIYTYISLNIYNMTTFKVDITIDENLSLKMMMTILFGEN